MTIYTITTLVTDSNSDSCAYSEPFLSQDEADGYYEAETGYYIEEYNANEGDIDEFVPKRDYGDGIIKAMKVWASPGVYIEVTYKKHEK